MGDEISVDPGTLQSVGAAVRACGPDVHALAGHVGGLDGIRQAELSAALGDFRTAWRTTLSVLGEDVELCGRALQTAGVRWQTQDALLVIGGRSPIPHATVG
ncbi:MAG: hypothetical protein ACR2F6_04905 [Mycobacteriales bacterium]